MQTSVNDRPTPEQSFTPNAGAPFTSRSMGQGRAHNDSVHTPADLSNAPWVLARRSAPLAIRAGIAPGHRKTRVVPIFRTDVRATNLCQMNANIQCLRFSRICLTRRYPRSDIASHKHVLRDASPPHDVFLGPRSKAFRCHFEVIRCGGKWSSLDALVYRAT